MYDIVCTRARVIGPLYENSGRPIVSRWFGLGASMIVGGRGGGEWVYEHKKMRPSSPPPPPPYTRASTQQVAVVVVYATHSHSQLRGGQPARVFAQLRRSESPTTRNRLCVCV